MTELLEVKNCITTSDDTDYHKVDGSLLSASDYPTLYTKLGTLDADYLTDETTWQNEVATYGVCGKFVYDSVNQTVRIPNYGNRLYTATYPCTTNYYMKVK